jgi:hypothetical protein
MRDILLKKYYESLSNEKIKWAKKFVDEEF